MRHSVVFPAWFFNAKRISFATLLTKLALLALISFGFSGYSNNRLLGTPVAQASAMDPHRLPAKGPWFEGWYTRIESADGSESFALIVGSYLPADGAYAPSQGLPGYVGLLHHRASTGGKPEGALEVTEMFPTDTHFTSAGGLIPIQDPTLKSPAHFEWTAANKSVRITQNELFVKFPGGKKFAASLAEPLAWDSTGHGPEGFLTPVRLFPLHWFVYNLGSQARFSFDPGDDPNAGPATSGVGFAHQEKNWGKAFPDAWVWSQGRTSDNQAQFALAGGEPLNLGPFSPQAWLIGVRSPAVGAVDFRPHELGTVFQTRMKPCSGTFSLVAKNAHHTLELDISARPESFAPIAIPSVTGFIQGGAQESFAAQAHARVFTHSALGGLFGKETLVDDLRFDHAALEFGGGYICKY